MSVRADVKALSQTLNQNGQELTDDIKTKLDAFEKLATIVTVTIVIGTVVFLFLQTLQTHKNL